MPRAMPFAGRTAAFSLLLGCVLPGVAAAAGPAPAGAKAGGRAEPGVVEKNVPFVIGGAITAIVLAAGVIFLGGKRPANPAAGSDDPLAEPLSPPLVKAPSPLRHLVAPALFVTLLGAGGYVGYSLHKDLPDKFLPAPVNVDARTINLQPAFQMPKMEPLVLPPPVHIPQFPPPPVRVPVVTPPHPPRR